MIEIKAPEFDEYDCISFHNIPRKTSGVYCIYNAQTNKKYIGSSENVTHRLVSHFRDLKQNKHCNRKLQNAWNKYGQNVWRIIIVEIVDTCLLLDREQYWIDYYKVFRNGYNLTKFANAPMRGKKHSEKSKKLCAIASAKLDRRNLEYRKKLSQASSGINNGMYGHKYTTAELKKLSESHKGILHTEETKKKMSASAKIVQAGKKNGFYGHKHTEQWKREQSKNWRLNHGIIS